MPYECNNFLPLAAVGYFTLTMSVVCSVFGFVGNGIVGILVILNPTNSLRTPANYFLLNLALSDMIVACITLPISAFYHVKEIGVSVQASNNVVLHTAFFISVTACCLNIIALSVDRYIAVRWSMWYRNKVRLARSLGISMSIWAVSGLLSMAYIKLGYVTYLLVFANGILILTLIVLTALYMAVSRALTNHDKELVAHGRSQSTRRVSISLELRQKKVTRVFLVVIILFLACTAPAEIFIYIINFCSKCPCTLIHTLQDLQPLFVMSTGAINPFVCTLRLPAFRSSLCQILHRIGACLRFSKHPHPNKEASSFTTPSSILALQNIVVAVESDSERTSPDSFCRPSRSSSAICVEDIELHIL